MPDQDSPIVIRAMGGDPGLEFFGLSCIGLKQDGSLVSVGVKLIHTVRDRESGVRAGMDTARRMREILVDVCQAVQAWAPHVFGIEDYETRQPKGVDNLREACTKLVQLGVPSTREAFVELLKDDRMAASWVESMADVSLALRDTDLWQTAGLGQAAKTIGAQWLAFAVGSLFNVPSYIYTPTQLKMKICRNRRASKAAVGEELERMISGLCSACADVRASSSRQVATSEAAAGRVSHVHDATGHALLALREYQQWAAAYGAK